jgi:hypothetical protein
MIEKLILLPVMVILLTASNAQHVYVINYKELTKYAKQAKEPAYESFARYLNGDTLKGSDLKKEHNYLNGKDKWAMDGRKINFDSVVTYQNEDCFRVVKRDTSWYKDNYIWQIGRKAQPHVSVIEYTRVSRGKINLYLHQIDDSYSTTDFNTTTNSYHTNTSGGVHTMFYFGRGDEVHWACLECLKQEMQDCPNALMQIDSEFKETRWYKHSRENINDYRALIRICETYNNCK